MKKKTKLIDIEKEYTDLKKSGSFLGAKSFFKELKKRFNHLKYKDVIEKLREIDSYTLYKSRKKKYKRSKIIVPGLNHTFQIDLCDMRLLSKENDMLSTHSDND